MFGFLGKVAKIALKVTSVAIGIQPVLQKELGGQVGTVSAQVVSDLINISSIIENTQIMGEVLNLQGTQKLAAASPLVAQIILKSDLMIGKKIKDETLFKSAVAGITSNMADLLNSLDEGDVKEENKKS